MSVFNVVVCFFPPRKAVIKSLVNLSKCLRRPCETQLYDWSTEAANSLLSFEALETGWVKARSTGGPPRAGQEERASIPYNIVPAETN